jgi:hypothetical protein
MPDQTTPAPENHRTASARSESPPPPSPEPAKQKSNVAQIVSATFSGVSALISSVALIGIFLAYMNYRHSLDAERIKAAEDSIARLYGMDFEVQRTFLQYPKVRACLRKDDDGKKYGQLSDDDKQRFTSACAMAADEFEYYLLIRDKIAGHRKSDEIVAAWNEFMKTVCEESYGFRSYVAAKRGIWTVGFRDAFDKHAGNHPFEIPK